MKRRQDPEEAAVVLRPIDRLLAAELERTFAGAPPDAVALSACASAAAGRGHTALDLADTAQLPEWPEARLQAARAELASWVAVGAGEAGRPLVLDAAGRLYLRRYHACERAVATALAALGTPSDSLKPTDARQDRALIARVFEHDGADPDQRAVVEAALGRRLTVVLGGPGSGKTFTVLRLLAVLAASGRVAPGRVRLGAATGKAAQRLGQAIADGRAALMELLAARRGRASAVDEALARVLPELPAHADTLHAVLGARPLSTYVRHDRENPVPCELLVVDEASMVDLPLFARLLAALPPGARLVLLGDPDQLASVEVGSVLAELARVRSEPASQPQAAPPAVPPASPQLSLFGAPSVEATAPAGAPLESSVFRLRGNHRTAPGSALPRLLDAVREGDRPGLEQALAASQGVAWLSEPAQRGEAVARALSWYEPVVQARDPAVALAAFEDARVLVALRSGPDGVDGWNRELMRGLGLADARGPWPTPGPPRRGTPLLVTRNDPNTGLANGDVVLAWGARSGQAADHVLARAPDGSLRRIALDLLPPTEPALAMTVHKAQGSEYRHVLVAPPFEPHRLCTREWLYTAFSRARGLLVVHAGAEALAAGLAASSRRTSGLSDMLAARPQGRS